MDFQKSLEILNNHRCPHKNQKEEAPKGLFGQEIDLKLSKDTNIEDEVCSSSSCSYSGDRKSNSIVNLLDKIDLNKETVKDQEKSSHCCVVTRTEARGEDNLPLQNSNSEVELDSLISLLGAETKRISSKNLVTATSQLKRKESVEKELSETYTEVELLELLLKAQEERTKTFHVFNAKLEEMLKNGSFVNYQMMVADITAKFSCISNLIIKIENVLKCKNMEHKEREISTMMESDAVDDNVTSNIPISDNILKTIRKLQLFEKEHLTLTAALHVEKIRFFSNDKEVEEGKVGQESNIRTSSLLKEGIHTLNVKSNKVLEYINDCIDELNCEIVEIKYDQ